ncbi:MAG: PD-(D/E)XK nuclease family protein [Flavobacteriales bacterium]|nr:PD-(D/E)XK nuclease family protein [Flavobacteriales bacterium]
MVGSFLEYIAQEILSNRKRMDALTIVLPSKRSIVFLKHHLSQKIDEPIWLPNIYSIEDFITELSGLNTLDNLSLQFKLYEVFNNNRPAENEDNFEQFLKWSQTILYDFNEMDRYLVDAKALLTNLRDIKELEQWSLNSAELTSFQEKYVQFFAYLFQWYTAFTTSLLEENLAYQGLAYRKAADNIQTIKHHFDEVWFVGLNALTTAENQIVNHFVTHNNARLFWDADAHYVENDKHEAGLFLRQHFQKWGSRKLTNYFEQDKSINIIGCAKNVGQSRVAGNLLNDLASDDLKNSQTALVLADENLLFPVLNNLPESIQAVNITMGAPIGTTPLYSLIDLLFKSQLKKANNQQQKFFTKDLQKIFRHPYMSRLFEPSLFKDINQYLSKEKILFVSASTLRKRFKQHSQWGVLSLLLGDWSETDMCLHSVKTLLDTLKNQLISEKASVESEVLFSFFKSLQVLENHLQDFESEMDLKTLRAIFFQIISKETISFMGEPLNGLQMMGVLETRTLDFKNLIVLSVNEEKLPAGKSVNSFIPFVLKKYFKMPTHEERDAIFAYHFYRLLQRAENVFLLYNTQSDDFGSGEKSRFITQISNELSHLNIKEKVLQSNASHSTEFQPICIRKTDAVKERILEWANHKVSPTSLNTFINCKLQFYFKYIAKIYVEDDLVEFMEAHSFGTIIHEALHHAYQTHLEATLTVENLDQIKDLTLTLIDEGFKKEVGQAMYQGKNHLIWKVAQRLTKNYFEIEKQFINDSIAPLKVTDTERSLPYELTVKGVNFKLFGNVDRVDQVGDSIRIVDYKSGKVNQSELKFKEFSELTANPKKSKAFQLMTYAYLYSKSVLKDDTPFRAGNYSFRNLEDGLIYVKMDKTPLKMDTSVLDEFEDVLKDLLSSILDEKSDFYPTDDESACTWCDFKTVCGRW